MPARYFVFWFKGMEPGQARYHRLCNDGAHNLLRHKDLQDPLYNAFIDNTTGDLTAYQDAEIEAWRPRSRRPLPYPSIETDEHFLALVHKSTAPMLGFPAEPRAISEAEALKMRDKTRRDQAVADRKELAKLGFTEPY